MRGQNVPNLGVAPLGRDGRVLLYNGSPGATQFLADVAGCFRSGS